MAIELTPENVNAAKVILGHDVIKQIFDEMEHSAIEKALNTGPLDHELRLAFLNEAKVIRAVRSKLAMLGIREQLRT